MGETEEIKSNSSEEPELDPTPLTDRLRPLWDRIAESSAAWIFAVVAGTVLVLGGIAGLILNFDFSTGDAIFTERLLFMDVNGWSSLVLLLTGIALLVASRIASATRRVAIGVGCLYLLLVIWSLFDTTPLGMLPINDPTAIFYAAIGVLGVTVGAGPERSDQR